MQIGIPVQLMRGLVVIIRCIGLVGHLHEEHLRPSSRTLWKAAVAAVPYVESGSTEKAGKQT